MSPSPFTDPYRPATSDDPLYGRQCERRGCLSPVLHDATMCRLHLHEWAARLKAQDALAAAAVITTGEAERMVGEAVDAFGLAEPVPDAAHPQPTVTPSGGSIVGIGLGQAAWVLDDPPGPPPLSADAQRRISEAMDDRYRIAMGWEPHTHMTSEDAETALREALGIEPETVAERQVWLVQMDGENHVEAVYDNKAAANAHVERGERLWVNDQPVLTAPPEVHQLCTVTLEVSWTNAVRTVSFREVETLEQVDYAVRSALPFKDWNGHWVDEVPVGRVFGQANTWRDLHDDVVAQIQIVGGILVDVSGGKAPKEWQPVMGFCRWEGPTAYAYPTPPTDLPGIEAGYVHDLGYSKAILFAKERTEDDPGGRGWFIPDTATEETVWASQLQAMTAYRDTLPEGSEERRLWDRHVQRAAAGFPPSESSVALDGILAVPKAAQ